MRARAESDAINRKAKLYFREDRKADAVDVCLTVVQAATAREERRAAAAAAAPSPPPPTAATSLAVERSSGDPGDGGGDSGDGGNSAVAGGDDVGGAGSSAPPSSAAELSDLADAFYIIGWVRIHAGDHSAGYATWEEGCVCLFASLPVHVSTGASGRASVCVCLCVHHLCC